MTYLLVEPAVKAIAPNIALMKWARYCELNSIEFQYVRGCVRPNVVPDKILMSCIFTFYPDIYEKTIDYYTNMFPGVEFIVGGVFPSLYPEWFKKEKWSGDKFYGGSLVRVFEKTHPDIENLTPKYNIDIKSEDKLYSRNSIVLYSSRGCVNKCSYCAVPRLEGKMNSFRSIKNQLESAKLELPDAKNVVLYDNNFTEHQYFDDICNELIEFGLKVDIHGLHVESFNDHKAEMFSKMKWGIQSGYPIGYLRFSFDKLSYKDHIENAFLLYKKHNIKAQFFLYCLYNYLDTPEDLFYRIDLCHDIIRRYNKPASMYLFPQRYIPFNPYKTDYIGKDWDEVLLNGFINILHNQNNFLAINKSGQTYKIIGNNPTEFKEKCYMKAKKSLKKISLIDELRTNK